MMHCDTHHGSFTTVVLFSQHSLFSHGFRNSLPILSRRSFTSSPLWFVSINKSPVDSLTIKQNPLPWLLSVKQGSLFACHPGKLFSLYYHRTAFLSVLSHYSQMAFVTGIGDQSSCVTVLVKKNREQAGRNFRS